MMAAMTWTAPMPAPITDPEPLVGPDRPMLEAFLADQRRTLLAICAGLTGEQLASRPVPPSTLSLLGLVRHLTKVERIWFRQRASGEPVALPYDPALGKDADFEDLHADRAEQDLAAFREECTLADAAAARLSFDDTFVLRGETYSLRLVYVHMVAEYAQHNGHADLLRQAIDGTTRS